MAENGKAVINQKSSFLCLLIFFFKVAKLTPSKMQY